MEGRALAPPGLSTPPLTCTHKKQVLRLPVLPPPQTAPVGRLGRRTVSKSLNFAKVSVDIRTVDELLQWLIAEWPKLRPESLESPTAHCCTSERANSYIFFALLPAKRAHTNAHTHTHMHTHTHAHSHKDTPKPRRKETRRSPKRKAAGRGYVSLASGFPLSTSPLISPRCLCNHSFRL